jgi:Flp pilus assembly CpaF family ATPase
VSGTGRFGWPPPEVVHGPPPVPAPPDDPWPPAPPAAAPGRPEPPAGSRWHPDPPPEPGLRGTALRAATLEVFRRFSDDVGRGVTREQATPLAAALAQEWAAARVSGGGTILSAADQDRLAAAVLDEQFGLGPLQPYADAEDIENLDINGPGIVWARRRGGLKTAEDPIAVSNEDLIGLVRTWGLRGTQTAREFSEARPLLNAGLGGTVRLSAVMSVTRDVHVSVRFHRLTSITLQDLAGPPWATLSPELAHFLAACVRAHINILVTGGVDAGKTTLLRALCAAIDPGERIATLESDRELFLDLLPGQHLDVIPFEARQANSEGVGAIGLHDLIPQALRMNPRRIIVGEVRDQEIRPLIEAMNSGQEGSMATLHANSAGEVFNRVLMLAQRGQMMMSADAIYLAIGLSRPVVVHIRKGHDSARYVSEVIEVLPPADGVQPSRNQVFRPGPDGRAVPAHSLSPETLRSLIDAGLNPAVLAGGLP